VNNVKDSEWWDVRVKMYIGYHSYSVFEWEKRTGMLCLRTPKAWGEAL